jgi:2-polyprenyl-3-methyl-5-hydroxy-6-metoxy-1,4-benzoquinol methylase
VRVTSESIQQLYEEHDFELYNSFPTLINGLREHVDRIHTVCSLVREIAPVSVLDVGCNRGLFGSLIRLGHGSVKRVVGIDISRLSCKHAKEQMGYDEAWCHNASELFLLNERFDLALCMEIIEHVPDPMQVIKNVYTHLRPGGFAIFSCPEEVDALDGEFHVRRVSREELRLWILQGLFDVEREFFLQSEFCEKPKWQGWNFVIGVKPPKEF